MIKRIMEQVEAIRKKNDQKAARLMEEMGVVRIDLPHPQQIPKLRPQTKARAAPIE